MATQGIIGTQCFVPFKYIVNVLCFRDIYHADIQRVREAVENNANTLMRYVSGVFE